jgi:FMN phosphatase YigB (HAD superfamily)
MQDLLRSLAGRYELALLSDHAREWVDFIRQQHPFLEFFSHQFFSYELRHTKRERITFLTVLHKLGARRRCVFVDDLPPTSRSRSVGSGISSRWQQLTANCVRWGWTSSRHGAAGRHHESLVSPLTLCLLADERRTPALIFCDKFHMTHKTCRH